MTFSDSVAARTMYMECRGEPEAGQRAVAHVLVNRLRSTRWGTTLAAVCLARKQFSAWNENDINRLPMALLPDDHPLLVKFAGFIQEAINGEPDPTQGALHYFAVSIKEPVWAKGKPFTQIGNHRFIRGVL